MINNELLEEYYSGLYQIDDVDSKLCELHSILSTENRHNCVPCNLVHASDNVLFYLSSVKEQEVNIYTYRIHLFNMYLMSENFIVLLKTLGYNFKQILNEFSTFIILRKWANFFKHPKSFLLVHHPNYILEDRIIDNKNEPIIDFNFVMKYYSFECDKLNKELESILKNKTDLNVMLPNIKKLTSQFCIDISMLVDMIKNNKDYITKLSDEYTVYNYLNSMSS